MARVLRAAVVAPVLLTLATAMQPVLAAGNAESPRLVVLLVIDGLPQRQVLQYRDQLAPDGFRRFLDRGVWFSEAHYGHAFTVTAAGHAVMLTGANPQRTGIIGNDWIDPATRQRTYNTQDTQCEYLGHKTEPLAGTSPRLLRSESVGDVLRSRDAESKVIGISGKDRGAILPAGHKGVAYMYMSSTGEFATSSCYMNAHPAWVQAFNAAKPADGFFGKAWAPLLPEEAYARSVPDGQSWQSTSGNGNRLPAVVGEKMDKPGPKFYENILPTPFGDELTLAFARSAVEGEQLGADGKPDVLIVSLSSHDYVNHAFGPESRLSHDHVLHLDRHLQSFFRYLDQRVGADCYLAVLTADHGFADTPEWAATQGREGKRVSPSAIIAHVNADLTKAFGEGKWVTEFSTMGFLFDEGLIRQRQLQPDEVYEAARLSVLKHPDVMTAFTRAQLQGPDESAPFLKQARKTWHPDRSPPLLVVTKPDRLYGTRPVGSSHGTPHRYDTHVPLLLWGPQWVGKGEVRQPVEVADIAPTLAAILRIPVPKDSQGTQLPLPL